MVEKGKPNPAIEQAQRLAFDDIEAVLLGGPVAETVLPIKVGEDGKVADISSEDAIARALARNSNGSFERFMGMDSGLRQRGKMI